MNSVAISKEVLDKLAICEKILYSRYHSKLLTIGMSIYFHKKVNITQPMVDRLLEIITCALVRFSIFLCQLPKDTQEANDLLSRSVLVNNNTFGKLLPKSMIEEIVKRSYTIRYSRMSSAALCAELTDIEKLIADKMDHYLLQFWEGLVVIECGDTRVLSYPYDANFDHFINGLNKVPIVNIYNE